MVFIVRIDLGAVCQITPFVRIANFLEISTRYTCLSSHPLSIWRKVILRVPFKQRFSLQGLFKINWWFKTFTVTQSFLIKTVLLNTFTRQLHFCGVKEVYRVWFSEMHSVYSNMVANLFDSGVLLVFTWHHKNTCVASFSLCSSPRCAYFISST